MTTLPSAIVRTALVDLRAELLHLYATYPETFRTTHPQLIAQLDAALLSIEGNIDQVQILPLTCRR